MENKNNQKPTQGSTNLTKENYPLCILLENRKNITLLAAKTSISFHDGVKYWTMPVETVIDILKSQNIVEAYG